MKKIILLLIIAAFISCGKKKSVFQNAFNSSNLKLQEYSVNIHRDTTLITTGGIKIKIDANSISSDVNPVTMQVKEALTINDMIKAGLFTKSGNTILSSDGMFYINTKEKSSIEKPLHIDVPKNAADKPAMNLYEGKEDGKAIDWVNPQKIEKIKKDSVLNAGERLFKSDCASCHAIDKTIIGPALAGIENIRDKKWLYDYTRNNNELRNQGDILACCVYNEFNQTPMPGFTEFSDNDLSAIFKYIRKEAKNNGFASNYKPYRVCDSCKYYLERAVAIKKQLEKLKSQNGGKMTRISSGQPLNIQSTPFTLPNNVEDNKKYIAQENANAEYYQLTVKAYGWYNLDICFKDANNLTPSNLMVRIKMPIEISTSVMLVIPSVKLFTEGGFLDNKKDYGFDETNGNISLPQNAPAYVIAFAEQENKIYFAIQKFMTNTSQQIILDVKETNRYEVDKILQSFQLTGIEFEVSKTINADKIELNQKQASGLEKKSKICSCWFSEKGDTSKWPRDSIAK